MIGFCTKSIRIFAAVCALSLAASAGNALAMERQFPDDNCAITVPDNWHVLTNFASQPGVIAAYGDPLEQRCFVLQIYNKKPPGPLDDRFIVGYNRGVEGSGGGNLLSGKYIEVGGIKSYERLGTIDTHGKHASTVYQLVPGQDCYYNLLAMRFGGDANDDTETRQVIGSFRFIHPFTPTYAPNSAAYQIGKAMGGLMVVFLVVGLIVYVLSSASSNRQPPRPPSSPRPPPVPPGA